MASEEEEKAMDDSFNFHRSGLDTPADEAFVIIPSDSQNLEKITRGVYIGSGGNLSVLMKNGDEQTFVGTVAGTILPIRIRRVNAAGTTASSLLGLV
jgi:hypothetical protein